jgi:hypothetical protein
MGNSVDRDKKCLQSWMMEMGRITRFVVEEKAVSVVKRLVETEILVDLPRWFGRIGL